MDRGNIATAQLDELQLRGTSCPSVTDDFLDSVEGSGQVLGSSAPAMTSGAGFGMQCGPPPLLAVPGHTCINVSLLTFTDNSSCSAAPCLGPKAVSAISKHHARTPAEFLVRQPYMLIIAEPASKPHTTLPSVTIKGCCLMANGVTGQENPPARGHSWDGASAASHPAADESQRVPTLSRPAVQLSMCGSVLQEGMRYAYCTNYINNRLA